MAAPTTLEILDRLVAFPTVSRSGNRELCDYVRSLLQESGARIESISADPDHQNLWITVGPADRAGLVLSGHTDVVPVSGQNWSSAPFTLLEQNGRLFGRGTADMKGFVASALKCVLDAARRPLRTPLHLALSYDEEIGCVGVRSLLDTLAARRFEPRLVWIGEPTSLRIAQGHKGKIAWRACCFGRECHSALAPNGVNAIHLASDFISGLRDLQARLATGTPDDDYDIPYSTLHVGTIQGGTALNIVPARCTLDLELRNIAADDTDAIGREVRALAARVAEPFRQTAPEACIAIETLNAYPGLDTRDEEALAFMADLAGDHGARQKVAFGTEGGLFHQKLNAPTIVCGPGSMEQGHKPDEFVTVAQIEGCDRMMERLLDRLEHGVPP